MIAASAAAPRRARRRATRNLALGLATVAATLAGAAVSSVSATAAPLSGVDLSNYVRVGRHDLPEPSRTSAPAGSLLAQEASAVTYNWDTGTLFVVGDGGTSVVQVSKTGALIDSMSLPSGSSPQGTEFYDTEGISYVGDGRFVLVEERYRQINLFTYVADTTLARADVRTVKLGTTINNVGIEGISNDPQTGGYLVVKENEPRGIFQTGIDFALGTATNGSPVTENSVNLFDPALPGLSDLSDVFSLSNLRGLTGPESDNLLIISQESGKVVNVDRAGNVASTLTLVGDPDNPLSIPDQTHEGVTMDEDGNVYTVNEQGGGDNAHPQLWVFAPSSVPNEAPTAVTLANQVATLVENTSTVARYKVADVTIADDGLGRNGLRAIGPDAAFFEVDSTGLYIKAGTTLDFETKSSYSVSVEVDDAAVGGTPDATSGQYTLTLTDLVDETPARASVIVTEVAPWGSGDASYAADWIELTNTGTTAVDLNGWKIDDDSGSFATGIALDGVQTIEPGQSAIFLEGDATTASRFKLSWFGPSAPSDLAVGFYSGRGIGLSTGGDAVNVFDAVGERVTGVSFGPSTSMFSFDNAAGLGSTTLPLPAISTLSVAGVNGAFVAEGQTGSPGTIGGPTSANVIVSELAPWGNDNVTYDADWFELTNTGTAAADISGWKVDDSSNDFPAAVALTGVTSLAPGQSAVFIEGTTATADLFKAAWFGANVPSGFAIGTYSGSGIGLGNGDAVNVFDARGDRVTGVSYTTVTPSVTFDNAAGLGSATPPAPAISTLSAVGVNGAFLAGGETGSPGTIRQAADTPEPATTFDVPAFADQPQGTIGSAQTVTVTNTGDAPLNVTRVRIREADAASKGDFLLADETCTDGAVAPAASCEVVVRFAPGRANATTNATLVLTDDTAAGTSTVALTGRSTGLPRGDDGAQGPRGADGGTGPRGADGATGPRGADGATGPRGGDGATGPAGPRGGDGATGPAGPRGSDGAKGDRGEPGRDAKVTCRTTSSRGRTKVVCSVTLVRGGRSVRGARTSRARLVRNGRTFASGRVGALRATRTVKRGTRYTLHVAGLVLPVTLR